MPKVSRPHVQQQSSCSDTHFPASGSLSTAHLLAFLSTSGTSQQDPIPPYPSLLPETFLEARRGCLTKTINFLLLELGFYSCLGCCSQTTLTHWSLLTVLLKSEVFDWKSNLHVDVSKEEVHAFLP